jgi:hypothetical protein
VFTVLVLLAKNSDDRRLARGEPPGASFRVPIAIIAGFLILAAIAAIFFYFYGSSAIKELAH